ncbi:hypothetical protein [Microbacterium sp. P02]|uniref:hypothetical protein n=1 Tax=Microbacterium sp. P02 TaxID=3366260 RepID=UPI003670C74C
MSHAPTTTHARRGPLGPVAAERVSAGCYGSLVAASTLIGLGEAEIGWLIAVVILTNAIYYATHVFAYTVGDSSGDSPLKVARHHLRVSAPMISATFGPLIVVLLLLLMGVGQEVAVSIGAGAGLATLAAVATTGAVLRGARMWEGVAVAAVTVALGTALIIFKFELH